ncbi:FXYD domain-containing ion transport regulator 6-like isoform X2 [Xyrauchen texanus]|uniref:FXYD domain-containing ion transport regulator 6-like isoform X2 n=1 Tax=Xyrauchen texanus TaxID=154827 RepID=UPI0022429460|nr:FXYD domain-containing ion transport regulator 6-like isoform X2 [Xyrauchen texanus]
METVLVFLFSLLVYVTALSDTAALDGKNKVLDPFAYGRRCHCTIKQKLRAPGDEEAQAENLVVSKANETPKTEN